MEILISIVILIAAMLLGVAVPFAFGFAIMFLYFTLGGTAATTTQVGFTSLNSLILLCIPFFIIAGGVINRGKMGGALVDFIEMFTGKAKGKLGIASVISMALFGSISGSSSATLCCISPIIYPRMTKSGYSPGYAAALHMAACPLGLLIPPSASQILYAWSTGQSVLACFLSTVVPGIFLAVMLCIINAVYVRKMGDRIQVADAIPVFSAEGGHQFGRAVPALLFPVIVLGGIYTGIMTPTEAAAVSIVYAVPVCIYFYKGLKWRDLKGVFVESATSTGVIMVMIMIIMIFSRYIVMEDIPNLLADTVFGFTHNKILVLILVNLLMILCGMVMDDTSALLLCAPLLLPMVAAVGVTPIQFAAIVGVNIGMASLTPPTAVILYMGLRVTGAPTKSVMKPLFAMIFFAYLPTLILTTYVPAFSLFLPRLFGFEV